MGTPIFALRLPAKVQQDIVELSKVYGSPNPRAFAREILEVITGGDMERIKAFNARLIAKAGEQLTLKLNAAMDAAQGPKPAQKPAQRPVKQVKKGKATPKGRKRV